MRDEDDRREEEDYYLKGESSSIKISCLVFSLSA